LGTLLEEARIAVVGEHHDRQLSCGGRLPQLTEHLQAARPREPDIHQHQVWHPLGDHLQGGGRTSRDHDVITRPVEGIGVHLGDRRVVLDDQQDPAAGRRVIQHNTRLNNDSHAVK